MQKGIFHTSKEHLLPCERASFTVLKTTCYPQFMNLYYNSSNVLFLLREFGIRKGLKKLVISSKIRIFIGENQ